MVKMLKGAVVNADDVQNFNPVPYTTIAVIVHNCAFIDFKHNINCQSAISSIGGLTLCRALGTNHTVGPLSPPTEIFYNIANIHNLCQTKKA